MWYEIAPLDYTGELTTGSFNQMMRNITADNNKIVFALKALVIGQKYRLTINLKTPPKTGKISIGSTSTSLSGKTVLEFTAPPDAKLEISGVSEIPYPSTIFEIHLPDGAPIEDAATIGISVEGNDQSDIARWGKFRWGEKYYGISSNTQTVMTDVTVMTTEIHTSRGVARDGVALAGQLGTAQIEMRNIPENHGYYIGGRVEIFDWKTRQYLFTGLLYSYKITPIKEAPGENQCTLYAADTVHLLSKVKCYGFVGPEHTAAQRAAAIMENVNNHFPVQYYVRGSNWREKFARTVYTSTAVRHLDLWANTIENGAWWVDVNGAVILSAGLSKDDNRYFLSDQKEPSFIEGDIGFDTADIITTINLENYGAKKDENSQWVEDNTTIRADLPSRDRLTKFLEREVDIATNSAASSITIGDRMIRTIYQFLNPPPLKSAVLPIMNPEYAVFKNIDMMQTVTTEISGKQVKCLVTHISHQATPDEWTMKLSFIRRPKES